MSFAQGTDTRPPVCRSSSKHHPEMQEEDGPLTAPTELTVSLLWKGQGGCGSKYFLPDELKEAME